MMGPRDTPHRSPKNLFRHELAIRGELRHAPMKRLQRSNWAMFGQKRGELFALPWERLASPPQLIAGLLFSGCAFKG